MGGGPSKATPTISHPPQPVKEVEASIPIPFPQQTPVRAASPVHQRPKDEERTPAEQELQKDDSRPLHNQEVLDADMDDWGHEVPHPRKETLLENNQDDYDVPQEAEDEVDHSLMVTGPNESKRGRSAVPRSAQTTLSQLGERDLQVGLTSDSEKGLINVEFVEGGTPAPNRCTSGSVKKFFAAERKTAVDDWVLSETKRPIKSMTQFKLASDWEVCGPTLISTHKQPHSGQACKNMASMVSGVFKDGDFAHTVSNIVGHRATKRDKDKVRLADIETYTWVRARDLIPNVQVLSEVVQPTDIYQGSLSNCYLLSALSALAEVPGRVERLLPQKNTNKQGLYSVFLNRIGVFEEIILDEFFPAKQGKKFKFCHTKNRDIWAMLIEKAYAKIFGAFWNIGLGGCAVNALKDLTGAPSEIVKVAEYTEDELWQKLKHAIDRKFIVIGSSKNDPTMEKEGIACWHAYTVLSLHEIEKSGSVSSKRQPISQQKRIVRLRNPWGKSIYKSTDPVLAAKNTEYQQAGKAEAGMFLLPFEKLIQHFEEISICHYIEEYVLCQKRCIYSENDMITFRLEITQSGEYYMSVSKPDKRFLWSPSPDSFVSAVLARLDEESGSCRYLGGIGGIERDPFFQVHLTPGVYLAFVNLNLKGVTGKNLDYGLSIYGPSAARIDALDISEKERCFELFKQTLLDKSQTAGRWVPYGATGTDFASVRYSFVHGGDGYGYCAIWSQETRSRLEAEIEIAGENIQFLIPLPATLTDQKVRIAVEPATINLVVYEIMSLPCHVKFTSQIYKI